MRGDNSVVLIELTEPAYHSPASIARPLWSPALEIVRFYRQHHPHYGTTADIQAFIRPESLPSSELLVYTT